MVRDVLAYFMDAQRLMESASCSDPSGESMWSRHSSSYGQNSPWSRIEVLKGHLAPCAAVSARLALLEIACTSSVPRKVVSAYEAISEIPDDATVTVTTPFWAAARP